MRIAIVAGIDNNRITAQTKEAITFGNKIAGMTDGEVSLWVFCSKEGRSSTDGLDVDRIICAEEMVFLVYYPEVWLAGLKRFAVAFKPDLILFDGSCSGNELAVRLAYRLGGSLVNDCVDVETDGGRLTMIKPVYSGNLNIGYAFKETPGIVSVRSGVFNDKSSYRARDSKKTRFESFCCSDIVTDDRMVKKEVKEKAVDLISEAKVVVIVGRGVGCRENIGLIKKFAGKLGAVVGATRPVVNNGWLPVSTLVGMSGKKLTAEVCIVVGASGSTPLMAGLASVKNVIAINSDPDAPIFNASDYGMVMDCRDFLITVLNENDLWW